MIDFLRTPGLEMVLHQYPVSCAISIDHVTGRLTDYCIAVPKSLRSVYSRCNYLSFHPSRSALRPLICPRSCSSWIAGVHFGCVVSPSSSPLPIFFVFLLCLHKKMRSNSNEPNSKEADKRCARFLTLSQKHEIEI